LHATILEIGGLAVSQRVMLLIGLRQNHITTKMSAGEEVLLAAASAATIASVAFSVKRRKNAANNFGCVHSSIQSSINFSTSLSESFVDDIFITGISNLQQTITAQETNNTSLSRHCHVAARNAICCNICLMNCQHV